MKIGIIGAGNIGKVLSANLTKLGHEVATANSRGPETLLDFSTETGARAASVQEAIEDKDLIILTIPFKNTALLPTDLFKNTPDSTIIVDTGNYYPTFRDGRITDLENGIPESIWVEQQIGRSVIKTFNNIFADRLAILGNTRLPLAERISLSISGTNKVQKAVVKDLIEEMGFDTFDHGPITNSWRHQPGSPIYCTDLKTTEVRRLVKQLPELYTTEIQKIFAQQRDEDAKAYL